jgi:hypothetical protein
MLTATLLTTLSGLIGFIWWLILLVVALATALLTTLLTALLTTLLLILIAHGVSYFWVALKRETLRCGVPFHEQQQCHMTSWVVAGVARTAARSRQKQ